MRCSIRGGHSKPLRVRKWLDNAAGPDWAGCRLHLGVCRRWHLGADRTAILPGAPGRLSGPFGLSSHRRAVCGYLDGPDLRQVLEQAALGVIPRLAGLEGLAGRLALGEGHVRTGQAGRHGDVPVGRLVEHPDVR